ncbi:hypothetical protein BGX27_011453 [Mortierella sp. AM989]|nr:hypothetical protein BGX27_011453 [Mortierella sp. AM989]
MTPQFVNVASLVPDQRHCNLQLRVLSVETIAETIHPETGKIIQSAEAIVGDDTACILLNLKNGKYILDHQVNLLARNAKLRVLNAHVNMYRGFMRLEANEDEEGEGSDKPSITAITDDEDRDGDKSTFTTNYSHSVPSSSPMGTSIFGTNGGTTTLAAASSSISTATVASGSSSHSPTSSASSPFSSSYPSQDQLEVEMRLGTGGSVPLMEYYRTIEFTYFSTVEPVGR